MAYQHDPDGPNVDKGAFRAMLIAGFILIVIIAAYTIIRIKINQSEHQEHLEEYLTYLNEYCNTNYGDNWYMNRDDHINVHLWEPGVALALTVNPANESKVREKYEKLANQMYESAKKKELDYGVSLFLHNDLDTDRILMYWINGKYQEGD